jgi:transcription-repair coupling factor (superfamily II helicase)
MKHLALQNNKSEISEAKGTIDSIIQSLKNGKRFFMVEGVHDPSSKAFLIAYLHKAVTMPIMIITSRQDDAEELLVNIDFFLRSQMELRSNLKTGLQLPLIYNLPPWEILPYEPVSPDKDISGERLKVMGSLTSSVSEADSVSRSFVLLVPAESVIQRVIPKEILNNAVLRLGLGDSLERDIISESLVVGGYRRSDIVEDKGEFSIRGGILDIYPPDSQNPFRIEFMADTVESIREFDPSTQRSIREVKDVKIVPARELILRKDILERGIGTIKGWSGDGEDIVKRLESGLPVPGVERLSPFFYEKMDTIFDYVPSDTVIIVDEPSLLYKKIEDFWKLVEREYRESMLRGDLSPPPADLFVSENELRGLFELRYTIQLNSLKLSEEDVCTIFDIEPVEQFKGDFDLFLKSVNIWLMNGFKVIIVSHTEGQAERLKEILAENGLGAELEIGLRGQEVMGAGSFTRTLKPLNPQPLQIMIGRLSKGIMISSERLVFISEEDIFGPARKLKVKKRAKRESFSTGLRDLTIGDYVVHVEHGIGQYLGTRDIRISGIEEEFLEIEYEGSEKLYIPMDGLGLIQKYIGGGGIKPPLDKLGGLSWGRTKERIKRSIREMAKELLTISATREIVKGFAFSPDTHWHKEFADSFEYDETEDQIQAILDVVADMERDKPMDRLICGDVGYGKTEVAMRGAFKSVFDGKQAALLVPTTILAQQHFQTFTDRFHSFPIKIEVLSRFRSRKEQDSIIRELANGGVDIVIGTHRLLQKDVKFKDLGLVIIDEEQRFGVAHKERLKKLRETVDVLTLTATPIPRTLHLALAGVRDLSIIETPPQNRLAIKTFIKKFSDEIIRQAFVREMDRGGQIFFVHNRVESIYSIARYIQNLVPNVRIAVIHGQMHERDMEEIMLQFIDREYDCLLCTTIIESGLDIPAANTIIINRADKLGLAQLYQLRGRVGRDRHQAYAYLLIPGEDILSETMRKRLIAIEELSDLGSGFRLAERDMEIRGAGNLLGTEQSGQIAAVGFDLYCKLMEETVRELKGEGVNEEIEPSLRLMVKGYIPKEYIGDLNQRLDMYKKIDMVITSEDVNIVRDELRDRYGDIPEPVEILLSTAELKILSKELKIEKVDLSGGRITLTFNKATPVSADNFIKFINKGSKGSAGSGWKGMKFLSGDTVQLFIGDGDWRRRYADIKKGLQMLSSAC